MGKNFLNNSNASASLGLVADWAHALNGHGELADVLGRLAHLVRADAVTIVRMSKQDRRTRCVGHFDTQIGKIWPALPESFATAIVGAFIETAKAGSIWKLTESRSPELNGLTDIPPVLPSHLEEAIVSPLELASGHVDYIEFHFKHRPAEHDLNLLVMMIGTLVIGWGRRTPALVSKKLSQRRKFTVHSTRATDTARILDSENPAKLSRCEYRVCSMLKHGMTVGVIAESLSIKQATVRSHLSSIFSKTGVSGQVELLHALNRMPDPANANGSSVDVRNAQA